MLLGAQLPGHLWPPAVIASVYLMNHLPTSVNPGHISPIQYLHQATHQSYASNIKHLRAYGSLAYVHIAPETRPRGEKFIARARKGFLVGYGDGLNYQVWLSASNTVVTSSYVQFDEHSPNVWALSSNPSTLSLTEIGRDLNGSSDYVTMELSDALYSPINFSHSSPPRSDILLPPLDVVPKTVVSLE